MDIYLLVSCSFSSFLFFSFFFFLIVFPFIVTYFCDFLIFPHPFLLPFFPLFSLFPFIIFPILQWLWYPLERKVYPLWMPQWRDPHPSKVILESPVSILDSFFVCLCLLFFGCWFLFWGFGWIFCCKMLHQPARFIATMGLKSESGWLSGSHCRVLCSWSSISVMCGWTDLNSPSIFSFAPHAFLCLNPPPKSHWRSPSASGVKREATKLLPSMCLPITGLVAGTYLVVVEVHSLGPGRCTCKIETTGCCSYLFAGWCVVCLCL